MTAPEQQKEKTAAVGFIAFMGLALGLAGVLVAAAAVGLERAWSNGSTERGRSAERGRSWLDNQRAWLDADHRQRLARADARRSWLESGGDPASEPAKPSLWSRIKDALRRPLAQVAVAGNDFRTGFRDGWQTANDTRKAGGSFKDIVATRPGSAPDPVCTNCKRLGVPVANDSMCADCLTAYQEDSFKSDVRLWWTCNQCPATGHGFRNEDDLEADARRHIDTAHGGRGNFTPLPVEVDIPRHIDEEPTAVPQPSAREADRYTKAPGRSPADGDPGAAGKFRDGVAAEEQLNEARNRDRANPHDNSHDKENRMTDGPTAAQQQQETYDQRNAERTEAMESRRAEAQKKMDARHDDYASRHPGWKPMYGEELREANAAANNNGQNGTSMTQSGAPAAESNATVLRSKLANTEQTLHQVAELTDQLARIREQLAAQVRDTDEFATATGQSAQTRTALDEANAVSTAMGLHLGSFSEGAVSAEEQVAQASAGLRVAENAEDELRSAGADGRAVAPAGANA